jgi:hypothetical protein
MERKQHTDIAVKIKSLIIIVSIFAMMIFMSSVAIYNGGSITSYGNDSTVINGVLRAKGDFKYYFPHGVAAGTALAYTPNISQNVPFRMVPGLTVIENDFITVAGDSITIIRDGHYLLQMFANMSSNNNNDFEIRLRKNFKTTGVTTWFQGSTTGSGNYTPISYGWYIDVVSGDDLSFYLTNLTNNDDATIRGFKFMIYKMPE